MLTEDIYSRLSHEMLDQYQRDGQEETLHLEFKTLSDSELKSRDDRRNFARALSGFGNASGGLIIWGVEARKGDHGIDCVVALPGVMNVSALLARLNSLTCEAVDPLIAGIQHRVVGNPGDEPGFVVTLVPESDSGPHMAKLGENRYYKRSGDSFYVMEHYDIADMLGRRRRPKLEITVRAADKGQAAVIVVGLVNNGRAPARAPYLCVRLPPPFSRGRYGVNGNGSEGLTYLPAQAKSFIWRFGGSADVEIHPGVHEVALFARANDRTPIPADGIDLAYGIACDDQPLTEGTVNFPRSNFEP